MFESGDTDTSIRLLGHFEASTRGSPVSLPLQAQRVIAFLIISGVQVHRHELAGRLWPTTSEKRARGNLRTALWQIRTKASGAVRASRETVSLAGDVAVDYRLLLDTPTNAEPGGWATPTMVARLRSDLLPGWDEEWLIVERERIRQLRLRRLEEFSQRCLDIGQTQEAISAAYAAIGIEPLRESAHLALIGAHMADGNRAEAVRQVQWVESYFEAELGMGPSAAFQQRTSNLKLPGIGVSVEP